MPHEAKHSTGPRGYHRDVRPRGGDVCLRLRDSLTPTLRLHPHTLLLLASHRCPQSPDFAAGPTDAFVADRVDLLECVWRDMDATEAQGTQMAEDNSKNVRRKSDRMSTSALSLGTFRSCRCTIATCFSLLFLHREVVITASAITHGASVLPHPRPCSSFSSLFVL